MSHVSDGINSQDSAALLGSARRSPAVLDPFPRRLRRRGPRSELAVLRRSMPKHRRSLPGTCLGEPRHLVPDLQPVDKSHDESEGISSACFAAASKSLHGVSIFLVNVQCLMTR